MEDSVNKKPMRVVCYGDSNTYGYDPRSILGERYMPDARWVDIVAERTGWIFDNQGQNGQMIPKTSWNISEATDILIIMLGTNDLLQSGCADTVAEKMDRFLSGIESYWKKILLIAPPPMRLGAWVPDSILIAESVRLGIFYKELASRFNIRFADAGAWNISIAFDGVHFTEEGHRSFAEGILQVLESSA